MQKLFNVPFEYQGIASQWEDICIENLNIDNDEVLIVNCMYRTKYLGDETEDIDSARDRVLHTMKRINPEILILGILNGLYSSPFFLPRFREVCSIILRCLTCSMQLLSRVMKIGYR